MIASWFIGRNEILVFNEKTRYGKKIDTTILAIQIALLLLIAAPWLLMAGNKKRKAPRVS